MRDTWYYITSEYTPIVDETGEEAILIIGNKELGHVIVFHPDLLKKYLKDFEKSGVELVKYTEEMKRRHYEQLL